MKCLKCSYVSHDYLDACRKCSTDLVEFKRKYKLVALKPGDLDLGVMIDVGGEDATDRDRLSVEDVISDTPPSASHSTNSLARKVPLTTSQRVEVGADEETAELEVDIQFDTDIPNTSTEPGELTKTFYVPEGLAKQIFDMNLPERGAELDEVTAEPKIDMSSDTGTSDPVAETTTDLRAAALNGPGPLLNPGSASQYVQHPPMNTIDMRVGNLEDCFDECEDIQLDTTEIDQDIELARKLPATGEIEPASDISSLSVSDELPEPMPSAPLEELFEGVDIPCHTNRPNTSTEPRGLTKMFYVGLNEMTTEAAVDMQGDPNTVKPVAETTTDISAAALNRLESLPTSASAARDVQHSPVHTSDIRVGNLDDCLEESEDIQLDTAEIDQDIKLTRKFPATGENESILDMSGPSVSDETPEMSDPDGREGRKNIS